MNSYFPPSYSFPEYGLDDGTEAILRQLQALPPRTRRLHLLKQTESASELPEAKRNRRFLYRYLAMDPDAIDQELEKKKLRDLVVLGELYLSPIRQFNDPNEFRAKLKMTPDLVAREKWLDRIGNGPPTPAIAPGPVRQAKIDEVKRTFRNPQFDTARFMAEVWDLQANDFGIACFCQNPRSNLMWAHYARSHRGIAIQFDYSLCPGVLALAYRVQYREDLPELVWPDDSDRSLEPLLSKSSDWQYEAERRYVSREVIGRTIRFDARAVTGIILGQRFNEDSRTTTWLQAVLSERMQRGLPPVRIYRAQQSTSSYSLAIGRSQL